MINTDIVSGPLNTAAESVRGHTARVNGQRIKRAGANEKRNHFFKGHDAQKPFTFNSDLSRYHNVAYKFMWLIQQVISQNNVIVYAVLSIMIAIFYLSHPAFFGIGCLKNEVAPAVEYLQIE